MVKSDTYSKALEFKHKYPWTIGWRIKQHCKVIDMHLNENEKIIYVFVAQKNDSPLDIMSTNIIALTNRRIVLGCKRLLFGYFFTAITPDLFNDLKVRMGILWGKVYIDTVKELVKFSNISKNALPEIETQITSYMMEEKRKYVKVDLE